MKKTRPSALLLEQGAEVNLQSYNGSTALIYAATFGQTEVAK
ncbi:MAG: ankyrin repeat domain-containing protein [Saprospiraceae bacterium]